MIQTLIRGKHIKDDNNDIGLKIGFLLNRRLGASYYKPIKELFALPSNTFIKKHSNVLPPEIGFSE